MTTDLIYDVFLGGSCGDTTWRTDVVMPYLKHLGISFYNPQRSSWNEDMIKIEETAKLNSRLLLFVVDPRQVSLVSLIEISYLAAKGAPLIVVLPSDDDVCAHCERDRWNDRIRTFEFVRNVLKRHKIPMYKKLEDALQLIETLIVDERCFLDIVRNPHCYTVLCKLTVKKLANRAMAFARDAACYLSPSYLMHPFKDPKVWRIFHPRCRTDWLKLNLLIIELLLFITLCFCCPAVPVILIMGIVIVTHISVLVLFPVHWLGRSDDKSKNSKRIASPAGYDVYLGGSGTRLEWIKQTALPVLNKYNVSYMDSSYCDFSQRVAILPHCRYLFYVVTCTESIKSGLVELAYYVGTGYKVIGCIVAVIPSAKCRHSDLEESGLTENIAECYRRGLLYLKDMATSSGVPIIDDLSSALKYLVQKIRLGLDDER